MGKITCWGRCVCLESVTTPSSPATSSDLLGRAELWQYRDRKKPEVGTMPYSCRMASMLLCSAHYHGQHCTLQAFEQFGELYMHDPRLQTSGRDTNSEFLAPTGKNKPSGPAAKGWISHITHLITISPSLYIPSKHKNICIPFEQHRPNVESWADVVQMLCKCFVFAGLSIIGW